MSWTFPRRCSDFWLVQHPDVGGDAGVVEHVQREGDDGLQPVILDDPATDVALSLAGVPGEEGGTIMHLGDSAAEGRVMLHFAQHVGQKHHLTVAGSGHEGELRITVVFDDESGITEILLAAHPFEVTLPAFPVGRIGEHEIELLRAECIVGDGGVLRATNDVVRSIAVAF